MCFQIKYLDFLFAKLSHPAPGQPHRDLIQANGAETKEWFMIYTVAEVLTIGQRDIMENWLTYRKQFEKELRK